jgi:GMP synthase-like glutamine amidotransferase
MVVILKHAPFEGPGLIADMMEGRGMPCLTVDVFDEGVPLSAAGFSGLISMGGPMSVLDGLDAIEREKLLLIEAIGRGVPVLGICLGAQILASALGANIYNGPGPEIGWGEVDLTEQGLQDGLFSGVDTPMSVLHWHSDTFDLPPDAVRLAFSSRYEQQAFRVGRRTYGFQFHLEVDRDMVQEWVAEDMDSGCGLVEDPEALKRQMGDRLDKVRFAGALVFGRFLDLVAGRGSG